MSISAVVLGAFVTSPLPALSADAPAAKAETQAKPKDPGQSELLAQLAVAKSKHDARRIERQLQNIWSQSGSPSADLLLERGEEAMDDGDVETARSILDKLTSVAPRFAEGWHQRAAVATEMDEYQDAMMALRQVLALQPNHFGALAELGQILEEFGDKPHALEAYRRALALNPYMEGIDERIRELTRAVEGQGI